MKYVKRFWPPYIIALVVLYLAIANYSPGMILTGGDNLHPEFDFFLNIKRSFFAVWQEYQGLGVLAAMGHASDLPRQLLLWIMSFFVPHELLRYVWTMLTLFFGATGAYYLIRKILSISHQHSAFSIQLYSFVGSLFYLLNLATIQQYYTPYEVFTSHFAILPWLFLTTINYFQKPEKKSLLLLALTLLLATPQAYVPTIFVVWLMATTILTLFLSLETAHHTDSKDGIFNSKFSIFNQFNKFKFLKFNSNFTFKIKNLFIFYLLVFLINAFWLLPFAYFVLTNAHVDVNAKINQMASENIYLLNKEYGSLKDVMLFRGFWFQNVEPDLNGDLRYMFQPWRDHFSLPGIQVIGYGIFAVVLVGVWTAIRSKKALLLGMSALFLFAMTMLITATPPFEQINTVLRIIIPLFKEVFRFPFTKFSLLAALLYAIFLSLGLQAIIVFLGKKLVITSTVKQSHKLQLFALRALPYAVCMFFALCIFALSFPAFQGNLLYDREKSVMPNEYHELFSYMRQQDSSKRVAVFPHHTFWDWKFYTWGYSGSGFVWYGLKQPVLDRAFDMWGAHNENYYHELSQALYTQNATSFLNTLQKYQVSYLLVDKNVEYPSAPQSLFYEELEALIKDIPQITKVKSFDNIELYEVTLRDAPRKFVSLHANLPTINQYSWTSQDQAYREHGLYIADNQSDLRNLKLEIGNSYYFPFRTLFTLKSQAEKDFTVTETTSTVEFSQVLSPLQQSTTLTLPALRETTSLLPGFIEVSRNTREVEFEVVLMTPEVWLGTKKLAGTSIRRQVQRLPAGAVSRDVTIAVNGAKNEPIQTTDGTKMPLFLSLREQNVIELSDPRTNRSTTVVLEPTTILQQASLQKQIIPIRAFENSEVFKVNIPKIQNDQMSFVADGSHAAETTNCDVLSSDEAEGILATNNGLGQLQVQARDATACTALPALHLPHSEGYVIFITAEYKSGKSFHFWVENEDEKFAPIDTYLPADRKKSASSFILPPQDPFGAAYTFHVDSLSIGNELTENTLHNLRVFQIPYTYLIDISFANTTKRASGTTVSHRLSVTHPNESLYVVWVHGDVPENATLMLGQAYNPGWKLYRIRNEELGIRGKLAESLPFFFGEEVTRHVQVNNWANGWELENDSLIPNSKFIILYLPQYLEYLGFALLGITVVGLGMYTLKRPSHRN